MSGLRAFDPGAQRYLSEVPDLRLHHRLFLKVLRDERFSFCDLIP